MTADATPPPALPLQLTPAEARVLACLVEKGITTPAYYPMTANALTAAANQKSSRNPLMTLTEGETGQALLTLEEKRLVSRDPHAGTRVTKWRQHLQHQLLLKASGLALLTALLLRSAQTVAELRAHAAPFGGPADQDGVLAALQDLADRAQPLVTALARAPGQSAGRWMHRLCGEPVGAASGSGEPAETASAGAGTRSAVDSAGTGSARPTGSGVTLPGLDEVASGSKAERPADDGAAAEDAGDLAAQVADLRARLEAAEQALVFLAQRVDSLSAAAMATGDADSPAPVGT